MPELQLDEWLKGDMLPENNEITVRFTDAGDYGEYEGRETFHIGVEVLTMPTNPTPEEQNASPAVQWKGRWTMNKTSQRAVASWHGTNTDAWVGKTAQIYTQKENVAGKQHRVIYARGKE